MPFQERVKVLFLDLGQVIFRIPYKRVEYPIRFAALQKRCPQLPEHLEQRIRAEFASGDIDGELNRGNIGMDGYWQTVCSLAALERTPECYYAFVDGYISDCCPEPFIVETLRHVQKKFPLVIVSDGCYWNEYAVGLLRRQDLNLARVFISKNHGVVKPQLLDLAYEWVKRELEFYPEECLFVDDNQTHLNHASRIGMKAARFDLACMKPVEFMNILVQHGVRS